MDDVVYLARHYYYLEYGMYPEYANLPVCGYRLLTVDWYGDQYLEATIFRTESEVNSKVETAVKAIRDQTDLIYYSVIPHWDDWESSNTTSSTLLNEFREDKPGASKCKLRLGITYNRSTNSQGKAETPGFYAFADCNPDAPIWEVYDWPDHSAFMHELSHNLGANHCK